MLLPLTTKELYVLKYLIGCTGFQDCTVNSNGVMTICLQIGNFYYFHDTYTYVAIVFKKLIARAYTFLSYHRLPSTGDTIEMLKYVA